MAKLECAPNPITQTHLIEGSPNIEMTNSVLITTSSIAHMEKIYDMAIQNDEVKYIQNLQEESEHISDEQLFYSFRGQQIHMLNYLTIMIARETTRYYDRIQTVNKRTKRQVYLDFSVKTLQAYFPEEDTEELKKLTRMINSRIIQYPYLKQVDSDIKWLDNKTNDPRYRNIKIIDLLQLSFDVWNDWRFNQEFEVKKGVIKKEDGEADIIIRRTKEIERCKTIWEDIMPGREYEITQAAYSVMTDWRLLLGTSSDWEPDVSQAIHDEPFDPLHPHIISLLLNLDNEITFERLASIRYIVDLSQEYATHDGILTALIRGQQDITVKLPDWQPISIILIDIKPSTREAHYLETFLTKLQGWSSLYTRINNKTPFEIRNSTLRDDNLAIQISDIPVYHVNTEEIIQNNGIPPDFSSLEQGYFSVFEIMDKFQRIVELAAKRKEVLFGPSLTKERRRNRVPVKHTIRDHIEQVPREFFLLVDEVHPSLEKFFLDQSQTINDFLNTGDVSVLKRQMPLEGFDTVPIKLISNKYRKKLRQELTKRNKPH